MKVSINMYGLRVPNELLPERRAEQLKQNWIVDNTEVSHDQPLMLFISEQNSWFLFDISNGKFERVVLYRVR